uniref:RNase H type-1 domain-containing protein n=1 Tax=Leersia perrieri TaxID=77586 RepID=A0A0D9VWP3_9ORYZ
MTRNSGDHREGSGAGSTATKSPISKPSPTGLILTEKEDAGIVIGDPDGIPHFCFECGLLYHQGEECQAERSEGGQQWGEWLRAQPVKSRKSNSQSGKPVHTGSSLSSRSGSPDYAFRGHAVIRDLPRKQLFPQKKSVKDRLSGGEYGGENQREEQVLSPVRERRREATEADNVDLNAKICSFRRIPRSDYYEREGDSYPPKGSREQCEHSQDSPINRRESLKRVWRRKDGMDMEEEIDGARNEARFDNIREDPVVVANRTYYQLEEWANLAEDKTNTVQRPATIWQPPQVGWTKVNADGAYCSAKGEGSLGVIIRDDHGQFIAASSQFLSDVADATMAEIYANIRAAQLAAEMGITKAIFETDSMEVLRMVSAREKGHSVYATVIQEFNLKLRVFQEVKVV